MIVHLHKNFVKQFKKLKSSERKRFKVRRDIFLQDEFDPLLNNHPLKGKYKGYRSINVTGDLRVIYEKVGDTSIFVAIDSHSNLYR